MGQCCAQPQENEGFSEFRLGSKENNKISFDLNDREQNLPLGCKFVEELPSPHNSLTKNAERLLGPFNWEKLPKFDKSQTEILPPVQFSKKGVYKGHWLGKKRHGPGTMVWDDGARYDGLWLEDKTNIYGRLIHKDGDVYEGEWVDDTAEGHGKYTHVNGAIYEGEWLNDNQHGKGKESWPDGAHYEGDYVQSLKHGMGEFHWIDGSKYVGEFRENNIEGQGTLIFLK